ncbi:YceI family protein [Pantoea sp. Taur]|uniref:YceI family protein n=1 Tax=Pantoea sp. Taur TaxID=2576757 RepID=UPI001354EF77|nr:YceI family protein [Pantoea sp. Taur]MXP58992.1 YceI family protein [Pantoea sp. Taur]
MLKKTLLTLSAASLLGTSLLASAADYKFDKEGQHAFVQFRIQHLGYSWLYGTFKDFDGTFSFDEANPASDKVSVTLNTASLDTNHAERDKHIRSADFLNTAKFPQATFASTAVKKEGNDYKITGDLTLNGVTKPITLDARLLGEGKDPWGGYRAGFEAHGEIVLKEFNITKDLGPASQKAELIVSVEGVRQ